MLSRRGLTETMVYLLVLLISFSSALIVNLVGQNLINDYILKTLNLRLLLHGISLSTEALHTLTLGTTSYISTVPSGCSYKCVDCNMSVINFPYKVIVNCNCTNNVMEENNLLNLGPDKMALVCDDNFVITNIKYRLLFVGKKPSGGIVQADLYIYPKSNLFFNFRDYVSALFKEDIFRRKISISTEVPIDLNDYALIRKIVLDDNNVSPIILMYNNYVNIGFSSHDDYSSITRDVSHYQNLKGISDAIHLYETKGKNNFYLLIQPGRKLVYEDGKICEYACYTQNVLEENCNSNWIKTSCIDVSKFNVELCGGNECVGKVYMNYKDMNFSSIKTGSKLTYEDLVLKPDNYLIWSESNDCNISLHCNADGTFNISIASVKKPYKCNDLFCLIRQIVFYPSYTGCSSEGNYTFPFDGGVLKISDIPSESYFESILTNPLIEESYNVIPYGRCGEPDFEVHLRRRGELFSKIYISGGIKFDDFLINFYNSFPQGKPLLKVVVK